MNNRHEALGYLLSSWKHHPTWPAEWKGLIRSILYNVYDNMELFFFFFFFNLLLDEIASGMLL